MTERQEQPARSEATAQECAEVAIVARRAWAGIVTIVVAVCAAILTLAFAGATLLVSGFIPLSGLEGRISAAIEERLGPSWKVEAAQAELERVDGRSRLLVRQVSFRHSGGASFRAPEAILGYEPMALLRGDIRLVSLDLRGVSVRLGVNRDGALLLEPDAHPTQHPAPSVVGDPSDWDAFTGIMNAIGALADGAGLLGSLEQAGMHGGRITFVDPEGRQKTGLEDVDVQLRREGAGEARLDLRGRIGSRWKDMSIAVRNGADGTRSADLDIRRFEPSEAVALAFGDATLAVDGLELSGRISLAQVPGGPRQVKAGLSVAPGVITVRDGESEPYRIQGAKLDFSSADGLKTVAIARAELDAGATHIRGAGTSTQDSGIYKVTLDGGGTVAGIGADAPVVLERAETGFEVDPAAGEIRIGRVAIKGPSINAEAKGALRRVGDRQSHNFEIRASDSDLRAALAVWPAVTSPGLHRALSEQVVGGRLDDITVTVAVTPDGNERLRRGEGMDKDAIAVALRGSSVRFKAAPGLPLLSDAVVTGTTTGRTVTLSIPQATAELGNGRKLALSEGTFEMDETWGERPMARIGFRSTGTMDSLVALLGFPALRDFSPVRIDPAALRGNTDLRTRITLPLADDLRQQDVDVQSNGTLSSVASDVLLDPEKLDGANLALNYDKAGLTIRGEGRVGGDRAQIDIRQNARGQGDASLVFTLDNAARQRRGFGPEMGISGPVQVKIAKALGRTPEPPARVEVDFTRAAIDAPIPGLTKPAGRAGRASFNFVADDDGPDIEDLTIESTPILIKGRISLTKQQAFESASFSQVRLSPGDNLGKVDLTRDGALTKIVVRGSVLDARPFIRDLFAAPSAPAPTRGNARQAASAGTDYDLDLDVPILTGFNNEALAGSQLKLSRRGGAIRSMSYEGRIGSAGLSIKQAGRGADAPLALQSGNGGATLRFLDLYRRAYGGDLMLQIAMGDGKQGGEVLMRNFVVRDEPALKRVVGDQATGQMQVDRGSGAAPRRIDVSEVAFTKLRAEFIRSASRIELTDAVIWGQQIGFTVQGSVDYGRDKVDIAGTFVPAYAFNNAFAQVPIVGALLGGGQYGGLFAVNFRISGSATAPTMTINPLSALAPGILRRFVDPMGGAPLQQQRSQREQPMTVPVR